MTIFAPDFPRLCVASADRGDQTGVVETYPLELQLAKVR
jgi:hypothetical protein